MGVAYFVALVRLSVGSCKRECYYLFRNTGSIKQYIDDFGREGGPEKDFKSK